ncbi:MAG TPA: glycosyltransferase family 2 protein [Albidovulum sp.]|uniref:glycosyltransferase n=1 Tax=Albidovulum sp. TaxID=1872424 RepID=UPI002C8BE740|nr:glycosyltransferase family 2 protein [Albidovulum sp.]
MTSQTCPIGAVIVAFNAHDVIVGCVESLLAQAHGRPKIVVVDNASGDDTVAVLRKWAASHPQVDFCEFPSGERPGHAEAGDVSLVHSTVNLGFAGGVNLGLAFLAPMPEIGHFWVLNPDAFADPGATKAILDCAARVPGYALMGGRVCYADPKNRIQIDGGILNKWTGVSGNINLGRDADKTPMPKAAELDFITGANMVASRRFYEAVGPMAEDYFLYYEEADWAMRRGAMPLAVAPDFLVYHHAGTAIGSPTFERIASPFSFWFKYRGRTKFVWRFNPLGLPVTLAYSTAKALQLLAKGARPQAAALMRGAFGLGPPRAVRDRLSPEAQKIAFGRALD